MNARRHRILAGLLACPHCGQRVLIRHGVRLSPMLADLFDMIERHGEDGIPSDVLIGVFYPGKPSDDARNALKANVSRINDLMVETDIEVRAGRYEPYRVRKRVVGRL